MSCIDKWAMINCTIRNKKIAILALQEMHLDQTLLDQVVACFRKNLKIINSPHPVNPKASAGIAFVINKDLICPKEFAVSKLVPGRAIMLRVKWLETCTMSIINIYAPHNQNEQPNFWANAGTKRCILHLPLPDFVLGDFNITKDAIDWAPAHHDDTTAIEAMRETHRK